MPLGTRPTRPDLPCMSLSTRAIPCIQSIDRIRQNANAVAQIPGGTHGVCGSSATDGWATHDARPRQGPHSPQSWNDNRGDGDITLFSGREAGFRRQSHP